MSHEIEMVNGKASIILQGTPAWHVLGKIISGKMLWSDAVAEGFVNFEVDVLPLYGYIDGIYKPVTYGIFRRDTGAFFGPCEKGYTPCQPAFIGNVMDTIMSSLPESATYDCIGVLGQGQKIFATIRIPELDSEMATGDKHEGYLCFLSSFDRSVANTFYQTMIRVVCQNTVNMSLKEGKNFVKIKHTKNGLRKMGEISNVFGSLVENSKDFKSRMEFLANKELDKETYLSILDRVFPKKEKTEKEKREQKRENSRRENTISQITDLFEQYNQDRRFPEYIMSPYNLLNAITDYTDHIKGVRKTEGRSDDIDILRSESAMFGSGNSFKQQSMDIIYEMVGGCKDKDHSLYSLPSERMTAASTAIYTEMAEKPEIPENQSILDDILNLS